MMVSAQPKILNLSCLCAGENHLLTKICIHIPMKQNSDLLLTISVDFILISTSERPFNCSLDFWLPHFVLWHRLTRCYDCHAKILLSGSIHLVCIDINIFLYFFKCVKIYLYYICHMNKVQLGRLQY